MEHQNYAYFLIELAMASGAFGIAYSTRTLTTFTTWRFLAVNGFLYILWLSLDLLAVSRGVFLFPTDGNLPFRILGLPLEEHLFFPLHTAVVWSFVLLALGTSESTESIEDPDA